MTSLFDSFIFDFQTQLNKTNDDEKKLLDLLGLAGLVNEEKNPLFTNSPKLNETIYAFKSKKKLTSDIVFLFQSLTEFRIVTDPATATSIIQSYFHETQSIEQILSDLINNIDPTQLTQDVTIFQVETNVQKIFNDRKELQKSLNKVLREFGSSLDESVLENLLKNSNTILSQLRDPNIQGLNQLSLVINDLIIHLGNAEGIFKAFNQKSEEFTGNEPDEIKQLIRNWGDAITQIETLEQKNSVIQKGLGDVNSSRLAIAQSIQLHDLLEVNYDYLTDLVRSGDLESAGIL